MAWRRRTASSCNRAARLTSPRSCLEGLPAILLMTPRESRVSAGELCRRSPRQGAPLHAKEGEQDERSDPRTDHADLFSNGCTSRRAGEARPKGQGIWGSDGTEEVARQGAAEAAAQGGSQPETRCSIARRVQLEGRDAPRFFAVHEGAGG
jgi:hypothetical protein